MIDARIFEPDVDDELVEVAYTYDFEDINELQLEILHQKITNKIETIISKLNN